MFISDEQTTLLRERLPEYLQLTSRPLNKPFCCVNPAHTDRNPSMSYYPAANKVRCFSCGCMYDLFDLVAIDFNITNFNDAKLKAAEILDCEYPEYFVPTPATDISLSIEDVDFTEEAEQAHLGLLNNDMALKHFADRGLSEDIIRKYKLGYSVTGYNAMVERYPELQTKALKQALSKYIFPYFDENGDCKYFISEISDRSEIDEYNGKYRKIKGIAMPVFNERYLKADTPEIVFITEGLYDALTLEMLGYPALAICGSAPRRTLSLVKEYRPKTSFVAMCDNDEIGIKVNRELKAELAKLGYTCKIILPNAGCKDINAQYCRMSDKDGLKKYLAQAVEDLLKQAA